MTDSNATELKNCPFCKGRAKYKTMFEDMGTLWYVECDRCEATSAFGYTKDEARELWNTRAPEQAIAATLGNETCEIIRVGNTQDVRKCSACGKLMHFDHPLDRDCLNYCPNCGKAVKR